MSEYVAAGEMVEGAKCSISARRVEFKKRGLHKDPITNKKMALYELDRNCGVEVTESLVLTKDEQELRDELNVHGNVGDKIKGDAIKLYVDTLGNTLNFIVEGGHTGRHEASVAYSRIRTIGKIKVQFKMYDGNHTLLNANNIILIG